MKVYKDDQNVKTELFLVSFVLLYVTSVFLSYIYLTETSKLKQTDKIFKNNYVEQILNKFGHG